MKFKTDSIEYAFKATGRDPNALPIVDHLPEQDRQYQIDQYNLMIVIESINMESNGGKIWKPRYDVHEEKWEPRFWVKADAKHPSGCAFSYSSSDFWFTNTTVGSRFAFHSRPALEHALAKFLDLYISVVLKKE